MKPIYIASLIIVLNSGAFCKSPVIHGPFNVGIGKPGVHKLNSATPGNVMTVDWTQKTINPDGSVTIILQYASTNGQTVPRVIVIDSACTVAKDNLGNTVVAPLPASFCTSITTEVTQTNSLIAKASAADGLNF